MKKIILAAFTLMLSSASYADLIIPPKGRTLLYDSNMLFCGVGLFILFAVNTGIVLYLKRNK